MRPPRRGTGKEMDSKDTGLNKKDQDGENSLKRRLSDEKEKISAMDRTQKRRYFKDYYLVPTVIAVFVIFCIIWFLYDAWFARKNVLYTGALVGCQVSDEGKQYLTEGFLEVIGGRAGKDEVVLSEDLWITFSDEDLDKYQAADSNLYVNIAAGDFDYMLIDGAVIGQYASLDAFADLEEYVRRYQIAEEDIFTQDGKAVAVKLSDEAEQQAGIASFSGEVYLVIVDIKRNTLYEELLMEYLLQTQ